MKNDCSRSLHRRQLIASVICVPDTNKQLWPLVIYQLFIGIFRFTMTRKYYPSSKQFRDPPRYTHQPSMQQKVPFSLNRCSSSKVAFCRCVEWGWHIYNIVESESDPLTRRAVDLFEKEPLKGNSEVHLHTPTKFGEDRSKDLGGDREQTDRQTDKRCSIYSMMLFGHPFWCVVKNDSSGSLNGWLLIAYADSCRQKALVVSYS